MTPSPPTRDAVRQLLTDAGVPGGAHADVVPIDEGGEHASWWVGTQWVLRLALDPEGSERQRRELALRDLVRPHVPIAVPASVAHGPWAPGLTYTLDRRLPGASAELRRPGPTGESDLAGLLAGLRAVPPAAAAALGVPRQAPRHLGELRNAALRAAERLARDGEFEPAQRTSLIAAGHGPVAATDPGHSPVAAPPAARPKAPAGPLGQPADEQAAVVGHCDLKGEHLLVSDDGRVLGVLDWTDAAIGDPAEDVAGLAISIGAPGAVRAAERAGYGPDVSRRGLLLARYDTLVRLADRLYGDDDSPLPLLRAQRDRAWRTAASLTDPTTPPGV